MLDQARLKEVFSYDAATGIFCRLKPLGGQRVGVLPRTPRLNGYVPISIDGKGYYAHRLAWLYHFGKWPEGVIDHKNGVRDDNRIENLRDCNKSQNACNAPAMKDKKLKGAFWSKQIKRWFSSIRSQKKTRYLGTFDSEIEAHEAYKAAANLLHGEFANTSSVPTPYRAKYRALTKGE